MARGGQEEGRYTGEEGAWFGFEFRIAKRGQGDRLGDKGRPEEMEHKARQRGEERGNI